MALKKILPADLEGKGVKGQTDTPGLTAAQMQEKVEEIVRAVVIIAFNQNVDNTYDKTEVDAQIAQKIIEIGAGDMSKAIYGGSADGVVKSADKLATPRKILKADFDGTKDITPAQMGLAPETFTFAANTGIGLTVSSYYAYKVGGMCIFSLVGSFSTSVSAAEQRQLGNISVSPLGTPRVIGGSKTSPASTIGGYIANSNVTVQAAAGFASGQVFEITSVFAINP